MGVGYFISLSSRVDPYSSVLDNSWRIILASLQYFNTKQGPGSAYSRWGDYSVRYKSPSGAIDVSGTAALRTGTYLRHFCRRRFAELFGGLDAIPPRSHIDRGFGTFAVASVIFVETGLFFGFFLPGDSLLVTLGILAAAGRVNLLLLIPFATLAAIAGDQLNYFVGQRAGDTLAKRYTFFAKRLEQARVFYERHGAKAIVLARFVPVVRTFAPAAAGAVGMKYRTFVAANVVGGVFWVLSATLAGFVLGRILPVAVVSNLGLIVAVVIFISILPYLLAAIRAKLHG